MGNNYCGSRGGDDNKYIALEKDDGLGNFNMYGPDRDVLTDLEKQNLNPVQLFEKRFPFYRMDVNGFTYLVRMARDYDHPQHDAIHEVADITLTNLQKAFDNHRYWDDIKNENSELVQLIFLLCPPDGEVKEGACCKDVLETEKVEETPGSAVITPNGTPKPIHMISFFKLTILGILWC